MLKVCDAEKLGRLAKWRAVAHSAWDLAAHQASWGAYVVMAALAIVAGVAVRLIWWFLMKDQEAFRWQDQLMMTTHDAYFYAASAQRTLWGMHATNPRIPALGGEGGLLALVMVALYQVTPFALETINLFLPVVVSAATAVVIVLIGRSLGLPAVGAVAAAVGTTTVSYYNRTMLGCADTDMLVVLFQLGVLYCLIEAVQRRSAVWAGAAGLLMLWFRHAYALAPVMGEPLLLAAVGYLLLFHRREPAARDIALLLALAVPQWPWPVRAVLICVACVAIVLRPQWLRHVKPLVQWALVAGLLCLGSIADLGLGPLLSYARERGVQQAPGQWAFVGVDGAVSEAMLVPFPTFAARMAGSVPSFWCATLGLALLVLRRRILLISLPLVAMGCTALFAGLRFTVHAVPIAALGSACLVWTVTRFLPQTWIRHVAVVCGAGLLLWPNVKHAYGYRVATVMNQHEVSALAQLQEQARPGAYTVSWWDYGYPLWYYSGTNTLVDGGKHSGSENYVVSKILSETDQRVSAGLARIAVESYIGAEGNFFAGVMFGDRATGTNPTAMIQGLRAGEWQLPAPTRDVYLYLPYRMVEVLEPVRSSGRVDPATGTEAQEFLYVSGQFQVQGRTLVLPNDMQLDLATGTFIQGSSRQPIAEFIESSLGADGRATVRRRAYDSAANLSVVYIRSHNTVLIGGRGVIDSTYVKLFFLDEYDASLFEPVVSNRWVKVYRLKV